MAEILGGKNVVRRVWRPLTVAMLAGVGLAGCASGQEAPATTHRAATTTVAPPGAGSSLQVCQADMPREWQQQPKTDQNAQYLEVDPLQLREVRAGVAVCPDPYKLGRIAVEFPGQVVLDHCRMIAGEGSPGNHKVLAVCAVLNEP